LNTKNKNKNKNINMLDNKKILSEPWVQVADADLLRNWDHNDRIRYNQRNRQYEKIIFFQKVFDFLTDNNIDGNYFEFGIHRCRTFRMALSEARKHNLDNMDFYAFDSFEGLPDREVDDESIDVWQKGALTTSINKFKEMITKHGLYLNKIHLIDGYYQDTLTEELKQNFIKDKKFASLINIDCDFYKSAVPVFKFIDQLLIEGSVLYIDDMFAGYKGQKNKGVAKAFYEYESYSRWSFEKYLDIGWFGRSFIVQSK
jgi:hypothetical protein